MLEPFELDRIYNRLKEIEATNDFKRAYSLWDDYYEGREVSEEDQKFFDSYYRQLSDLNIELGSFSLSLHLIYWGKYVTPLED